MHDRKWIFMRLGGGQHVSYGVCHEAVGGVPSAKNSGKLALRMSTDTHMHAQTHRYTETHMQTHTHKHNILHTGSRNWGIKHDGLMNKKIYSVLLHYICVIKETGYASGHAAVQLEVLDEFSCCFWPYDKKRPVLLNLGEFENFVWTKLKVYNEVNCTQVSSLVVFPTDKKKLEQCTFLLLLFLQSIQRRKGLIITWWL